MKKFINNVENIVPEMLEGMELSFPDIIKKLGNNDIIVRKDLNKNKVIIISGGGSGHEPTHAGYVGKGMLDAAVCGPVFTSPAADQILEAIMQTHNENGVLLIIKNYTGDIMNFVMAEQMSQANGIDVDHVVINDDISLLEINENVERRGIAGTVLIHKVVGAKAESGANLKEVKELAEKAINNLASYGVGLDGATVPANGKKGFELPNDTIEMGLGIHGEPGVRQVKMKSADEITDEIMDKIVKYLNLKTNDKVALLVNGLGATPLMELNIIAREAIKKLNQQNIKIAKTFVGNYLTAIDMPGMSISVMKLDDELEELVKAKAETIEMVVA